MTWQGMFQVCGIVIMIGGINVVMINIPVGLGVVAVGYIVGWFGND